MSSLSGFPYAEIQFTKEGDLFDQAEADALQLMITTEGITDLFVISHGWNNDMAEARHLYTMLTAKLSKAVSSGLLNRKFAVAGILWPSKKFADKELIAGGAASFDTGSSNEDEKMLKEQLDSLKDFFDNDEASAILDRAKKITNAMQNDHSAVGEFVQQMNKLFQKGVKADGDQKKEDLIMGFQDVNPGNLLKGLEDEPDDNFPSVTDTGMQGAAGIGSIGGFQSAGSAAGLGTTFKNIFSSARNLLNFVTYYQMKERAGKVGTKGLNPLLQELKMKFPLLKLHLIGHSFGGRLVTAATLGPDSSTLVVDTLSLLQAAFSHYGFASKYDGVSDGFFRNVIAKNKVNGPIVITHTHNDSAVGKAYAIASRIAGQVASGVGGATDKFGGLGGNGAQSTPEADNSFPLSKDAPYNFQKGKIYNLKSDKFIRDHSDICKDEVARAIVTSIKA